MRLVTPGKDNNIILYKRSLTDSELDALINNFTGTRNSSGEQQQHCKQLLQGVWRHKQWLQCSCQVRQGKSPTMCVRRYMGDTYTLVRLPGWPSHKEDCPFQQLKEKSSGNRKFKHSQSMISALLLNIIQDIQLHTHEIDEQDSISQLKARYQQAKAALLIRKRSLDLLKEQIITHPMGVAALAAKLRGLGSEAKQTGFLFSAMDHIDAKKMVYEDKHYNKTREINFNHHVQIDSPLRFQKTTGGPYLVLAEIAGSGGRKNWFSPSAISYLPVYDKRLLFPVTSAADRSTLRSLLKTQAWLKEKENIEIVIKKPLRDCDEDFQVYCGAGRIISIINFTTEAGKITLPEVIDMAESPLFHIILSYADTAAQQRFTRKFQKILAARILSADAIRVTK